MATINMLEKFKVNEIDGLFLKVIKPGRILGYKPKKTKCHSIILEKPKNKTEKPKTIHVNYTIREREISDCFLQTFIRPENIDFWCNTKTSPLVTNEMLADQNKFRKIISSLNFQWNKCSKMEKLCYFLGLFDEGLGIEVTPYYEDGYLRNKNK